MTVLEVILLIVGVLFLVVSFFVSEKLSNSDLKDVQKLSEAEIKVIVEKQMRQVETTLDEVFQEKIEDAMEELERKTDKETTNKIMAISEFSDTVLDSMNKSHSEIVFMYDMLNDKQIKITELTKELQQLESTVVQMEQVIAEKKEELQDLVQQNIEVETLEVEEAESSENQLSMADAFKEHANTEEPTNDEILHLYKEGMSEVDIAKKLGRGLGEVKLVLGLFSGETI